jgi:hypothetical protein
MPFSDQREVAMRFTLLFILLAITGCGAGNNRQPTVLFGSGVSAPMLSTLTPDTAPFGSPTFTLTVNGNNFGLDATVFWNGTPARTIPVTSNQLMVQITDTDMQTAGMIPVFVRTAGQNSNTVNFNVSTE